VVIALKGKLTTGVDVATVGGGGITRGGGTRASTVERDAHEAMVSLGYSEAQVSRALGRVREVVDAAAPVEEWIRKALQVI
jgi:Holliday junction resolvasome RuvABC DNA-binding subunit